MPLTPFEMIDKLSKGEYDAVFPDPLQFELFTGFVAEAAQKQYPGFLVRYQFHDEGEKWSAWHHYEICVLLDGESILQPGELALPPDKEDDPEEYEKLRDTVPEEWAALPVFEYEWPLGLDWS